MMYSDAYEKPKHLRDKTRLAKGKCPKCQVRVRILWYENRKAAVVNEESGESYPTPHTHQDIETVIEV